MKKIALIFFLSFCVNLFLQINVSAQETAVKWMKIQSDNAEFSIEVPDQYKYFYDENGFWTSDSRGDYTLKKMNMLNAYSENTLVSVESYEAGARAFESMYEKAEWFSKNSKTTEKSDFVRGGVKIKQIITKSDYSYCVSQYFKSKSHIYILTAGSKTGDNATIRHFLDSLIFKPETKESPAADSTPFSKLKPASVTLTEAKDEEPKKPATDLKIDDALKLVVLKKEAPSYIESARMKRVTGKVKLRVNFDKEGYIPDIAILKSLPEGLLRQAIFVALRIKFLPQVENGKPISVTKTVEYDFKIY